MKYMKKNKIMIFQLIEILKCKFVKIKEEIIKNLYMLYLIIEDLKFKNVKNQGIPIRQNIYNKFIRCYHNKKTIKYIFIFFVTIFMININYINNAAVIYQKEVIKNGPGYELSDDKKEEKEEGKKEINTNEPYSTKYIVNTIVENYTIKYDDIEDNIKYANIIIRIPELYIDNQEKTDIANNLLKTEALEILKEYAKNYVISFNRNRANIACGGIFKRDDYKYKLYFYCDSIKICDIFIDFTTNKCYTE